MGDLLALPHHPDPDQGYLYKGLIGLRFTRSFMNSGTCDLSIETMESVKSVISVPSITNYHSKGTPTVSSAIQPS